MNKAQFDDFDNSEANIAISGIFVFNAKNIWAL